MASVGVGSAAILRPIFCIQDGHRPGNPWKIWNMKLENNQKTWGIIGEFCATLGKNL